MNAIWVCAPAHAAPETVNVKTMGAKGDGVADDRPAIRAACQKVTANGGGQLYFPIGTYRCARQKGYEDGIAFDGVSNLAIVFETGATLLLDDLNPENGNGDLGHGIRIHGPASNIWVVNAHVKWKNLAANRSYGDAFRFEGYPRDDKTLSNINLLNCTAEQSPQTGAIFMGCSDVTVQNFRILNTLADGLHFNACRRVNVNGVNGLNVGDDTVAFVTYYDAQKVAVTPNGPFSQPTLGDWNNTNSTATNIVTQDGKANGVRISGALNLNVSNIVVQRKGCGVILDSGRQELPRFGWGYLASRGITVSNLTAIKCDTGFFAWNYNVPKTPENEQWWNYDVRASNITARDCDNDSLHLWNVAGIAVAGVVAQNKRVRIHDSFNCSLNDVDLRGDSLFIYGTDDEKVDVAQLPSSRISLSQIRVQDGGIEVQKIGGVSLQNISTLNAPHSGVYINNVAQGVFRDLRIVNSNRARVDYGSGLAILGSHQIIVDGCTIEQDTLPLRSIEVSGGDQNNVTNDIWIRDAFYRDAGKSDNAGIVVQSGDYAPRQLNLELNYLNQGETATQWRKFQVGPPKANNK